MNVKIKTSLVIVFTLIVGMVIGALLNRALLQNRVRRVFSMRSPNAFTQSYLETIQPDADQEKILERNGQLFDEIRSKSRADLEAAISIMMSELKSELSPEQLKRLEDKSSRGQVPFGRHSAENELAYLSTELELTEDQTSKLEKILEDFMTQPRDKMERGALKEMSSDFRQQREKREEDIKNILTEEQKKKYNELMQDRQKRQPGHNRNSSL
ncbi:hypothetical protein ACFLQZ_04480 [Acidobacteriota bacterium]